MNERLGGENKKDNGTEAVFRRHSKALYRADAAVLSSDQPLAPMDRNAQVVPDLSDAGVQLAEKTAQEYFATLNPKKDKIFFVSSNLARALETAKIYADIAREMGFTVIQPEHVRGAQAEEIGGGDIRVLKHLSLPEDERPLAQEVYNTDKALGHISWDKIDPEFRKRWEAAHAIVMANDQGSWGKNYDKFSMQVSKEFPDLDVMNKQESYEQRFQPLVRLAEWGIKKAREKDPGSNIKILAFGHENYMGVVLEKHFHDHAIPNCEAVSFNLEDDGTMTMMRVRDGATATLDDEDRGMGRGAK